MRGISHRFDHQFGRALLSGAHQVLADGSTEPQDEPLLETEEETHRAR